MCICLFSSMENRQTYCFVDCYCATTDVSNDLINFPMCIECKGQKPIKQPKTKDQNTFTLFVLLKVKIMNYQLLIIITSCPHLLNFLPGTGNKVLINVGLTLQAGLCSTTAGMKWSTFVRFQAITLPQITEQMLLPWMLLPFDL